MDTNEKVYKYIPYPLGYLWNIDIIDEIISPEQFSEELEILRNASEADEVHIHINSVGGDQDTANDIMAAMTMCKGTVVTSCTGQACSAASAILLHGDEISVSESALIMIHNVHYNIGGKGKENIDQAKFIDDYSKAWLNKHYLGFLTETEIEDVAADHDYWFSILTDKTVIDRLNRHIERRKKMQEED